METSFDMLGWVTRCHSSASVIIGPLPDYPQTTVDKRWPQLLNSLLLDCLSANILIPDDSRSRDHRGVTWERRLARPTRSYIGTAVERAVEDNITCIV